MYKLAVAGLALAALIMMLPRPAAAQIAESKAWCRAESVGGARGGGSFRCYWDTWDQCRQSTEHLMGGSCFQNPAYRGPAVGAVPGPSGRVHRHRARRYGADH